MFRRWLAHPLTRDLPIDSPQTTELRREIIRSKPFLKQIYEEWCVAISRWVPDLHGGILELGSGGGILADHIPDVITSEVFPCKGVRLVADARTLPLASSSIRAIVLIDVLHHIPQVRYFFSEAARCLAPGGAVIMLEPWVSPWSTFVYTHLHHEPFRISSPEWSFPEQGPLSGANGALPWIVFERDRAREIALFLRLNFRSYLSSAFNPSCPFDT
jgi:SAM-dependent methyltransferase